jgi:hypothetical protein
MKYFSKQYHIYGIAERRLLAALSSIRDPRRRRLASCSAPDILARARAARSRATRFSSAVRSRAPSSSKRKRTIGSAVLLRALTDFSGCSPMNFHSTVRENTGLSAPMLRLTVSGRMAELWRAIRYCITPSPADSDTPAASQPKKSGPSKKSILPNAPPLTFAACNRIRQGLQAKCPLTRQPMPTAIAQP